MLLMRHEQVGPVLQADRHDRVSSRADQPCDLQPSERPRLSRGDHLHHRRPLVLTAAVQRAVLGRSQLVDVMDGAARGRCTMHPLSRPSGGLHAEALVQVRQL